LAAAVQNQLWHQLIGAESKGTTFQRDTEISTAGIEKYFAVTHKSKKSKVSNNGWNIRYVLQLQYIVYRTKLYRVTDGLLKLEMCYLCWLGQP
jgi:hypothetical protein